MPAVRLQPAGLPVRIVDGQVLYSHVVVTQPGRQVFISGQLSRNAAGEIVGIGDMAAQIRQVGENIRIALEAAGATLADLVATRTFVTDIDEYFKHVDARMETLRPGMPTSTTVEVRRLSHPEFMVEVEAVAALP